jgi:hypothetical protein
MCEQIIREYDCARFGCPHSTQVWKFTECRKRGCKETRRVTEKKSSKYGSFVMQLCPLDAKNKRGEKKQEQRRRERREREDAERDRRRR